eukprot:4263693-Pleurochrysis_carterae.AAC.2
MCESSAQQPTSACPTAVAMKAVDVSDIIAYSCIVQSSSHIGHRASGRYTILFHSLTSQPRIALVDVIADKRYQHDTTRQRTIQMLFSIALKRLEKAAHITFGGRIKIYTPRPACKLFVDIAIGQRQSGVCQDETAEALATR